MSDGPYVLVVEDELQIRRFLRISLATNNYGVYEAETGREALAKVDEHAGHHPVGARRGSRQGGGARRRRRRLPDQAIQYG